MIALKASQDTRLVFLGTFNKHNVSPSFSFEENKLGKALLVWLSFQLVVVENVFSYILQVYVLVAIFYF